MPARVQCAFTNPEKKSLEQLFFPYSDEDGVVRNIPALDKLWAPRRLFANYVGLVQSGARVKEGAELDEWKYEAESFKEDMQFLLNCRHHEFWSYMIYQKSALAAVVSFLQHATPFYLDVWSKIADKSIVELYDQILILVVRVICRLITNKETSDAWITKEHLRELIYKNFLISVPMLFDLISAVGDTTAQNLSILCTIFGTVLKIEPNYKDDLLTSLAFFKAAFRSIQTQSENEGFDGAGGGDLDEGIETPYDDVALYTLDCAYSLSVLLEVCPEVRPLCEDINLAQSIAHFYDNTIPFLYKNICLISGSAVSLNWLNQARLQYLRAFRCISYSYVEKVMMNPKDSLTPTECFISLMTECLSEQTFVADYQRAYPIELDVDILRQACEDFDDFKAEFVVNGFKTEAEADAFKTIGNIAAAQEGPICGQNISHNKTESSQRNGVKFSEALTTTTTTATTSTVEITRNIDEEVAAVLDVFPGLGTGFIRQLLSRYDNSEEAITAILENNLPPDLSNADKSQVYIPPESEEEIEKLSDDLYDKFCVMAKNNPNCVVKQGKGFPDAPKNAVELLDNKKDLETIRHRYQEYSLVSEDGDSENGEYQDEYDDSYDALLESEKRVVKSKDLKAVLADLEIESESDDDDDNQNGTDDVAGVAANNEDPKNRLNFCENPEDVRARYEERRQAKYGPQRQRNVAGAPKGQGQDKDTLRNRQKKETQKSSRANHNRKAGAAYKRSKGMLS